MAHLRKIFVALALMGAALCSPAAWAQSPEFLIINDGKEPTSDRIFLSPRGAAVPVTVDAKEETFGKIEDAFKRAATAHEALYGTPFGPSVAPRIDVVGFKSIVPIYISDDFVNLDPNFPIMSVEGPAIYADGLYYLRSPTPLLRKSYFSAIEQDLAGPKQWIEAQIHDLPISHSIAAFHQASKCKNWPIRANTSDEIGLIAGLIGRRTSTMKFFSTVTNAKALQGLAAMHPNVGSDYVAATITAHAIARAESRGMPADAVEAEIEKWIGGTSLKYPAFRSNWSEAGVADAFADPFLLTLMSSTSPQELYGIKPGGCNALAQFDTAFACADADAYRDRPLKYIDAFQDAFNAEALRIGKPEMKLSRALLHAQLHKIYLPQIVANQTDNPLEAYDSSFLNRAKWLDRIFKSRTGNHTCIEIDFKEAGWNEISGEIEPFAVHCFRIKGADAENVRNFTVSVTIEGDDETEEDYSDIHITASSKGSVGLVSKSNAVYSDQGGDFLKTWIFDTAPRSNPAVQEPDGSKLLFLFNIADRLSETKARRVRIDMVQGGATNSITAIRRVQENGRNKPATEYRLPAMPSDLTTRVSFDLQSKEEYADPKLILTYTYARGMENTMAALAKASSSAMAPVTGLKYPIMLKGGMTQIDLIEEQSNAMNDLAEQLEQLQTNAQNNRFPETVNVIIEAPAPEPGFTGTLEDVLISVNWSSPDGKPHSVESIGPKDMSTSPNNEIYLNNGTLNIKRFDRGVFIADYKAQLTHEPVLPPMRARQPFLNRDVAGHAQGTVVATGSDVAFSGDREIVENFAVFEELGAVAERIRSGSMPTEEEMAESTLVRTGSADRRASSGIGSAPANCNCSCETFWEQAVSSQCASMCRAEYMVCREQAPETRKNRLTEHAEAIEFYWNAMGITTPETQAASKEAILGMSDREFQSLLDGIEFIGGPKSGGN